MSKEILLIRNDDGEFELYDDTYDVVIHCKNRQGMKETCEILRKVGTDEKAPNALLMDPVDMAIAIRNHCKSRTGGCEGCCFDRPTSDNGDGECFWAVLKIGRCETEERLNEYTIQNPQTVSWENFAKLPPKAALKLVSTFGRLLDT